MAINFRIQTKGLKELKKAVQGNELYAKQYRDTALAIGALGERVASRNAPRGATGQLEARISHGVQKRPIPLWIAVRSSARRRSKKFPRGYFYGRLLNFSHKHGHAGWFTRPLRSVGRQAAPFLSAAARSIEAKWGRVS